MKTYVAAVCLAALTLAEPPPSNSYLPPAPAGRSPGGYPRGGPHSRSLGHGHSPSGFSRNAPGHGRPGSEQGYDHNASPFGRNGLEDGEPANYNFGYMVNDFQEGTDFGHHEERQDERAEGEYHVVLPDGRKQTVSYEADERGFKPHISYEDTEAVSRSSGGYDSNANNIVGHGSARSHGNGQHGSGHHGNDPHGSDRHGNGQHGSDRHGNGQHGNDQHGSGF